MDGIVNPTVADYRWQHVSFIRRPGTVLYEIDPLFCCKLLAPPLKVVLVVEQNSKSSELSATACILAVRDLEQH